MQAYMLSATTVLSMGETQERCLIQEWQEWRLNWGLNNWWESRKMERIQNKIRLLGEKKKREREQMDSWQRKRMQKALKLREGWGWGSKVLHSTGAHSMWISAKGQMPPRKVNSQCSRARHLSYLLVLTLTLKRLFFVNPIFTDGKGTLYDCHFYPKSHSQKKLPSKSLPHLSIRLFWGLRFRPRNPIPLPYILMKSVSPGLCGE